MGAPAGSVGPLHGPAQAALCRVGFAETHAPAPDRPSASGLPRLPSGQTRALEDLTMATLSERDWLACQEPGPMLDRFRNKGRTHLLRRFACACLRRIEHLLTSTTERRGLELAEQYAERLLFPEGLAEVRHAVRARCEGW